MKEGPTKEGKLGGSLPGAVARGAAARRAVEASMYPGTLRLPASREGRPDGRNAALRAVVKPGGYWLDYSRTGAVTAVAHSGNRVDVSDLLRPGGTIVRRFPPGDPKGEEHRWIIDQLLPPEEGPGNANRSRVRLISPDRSSTKVLPLSELDGRKDAGGKAWEIPVPTE